MEISDNITTYEKLRKKHSHFCILDNKGLLRFEEKRLVTANILFQMKSFTILTVLALAFYYTLAFDATLDSQ